MSRNSSAELSVLMDIVELAKRCGVRPSEADASINLDIDREHDKAYQLFFCWGDDPNLQRFQELLDIHGTDTVWAETIDDLQDRVDKALSLAPRARAR